MVERLQKITHKTITGSVC